MQFFDTHCHLNFKAFDKDFSLAIKRARENNIDMLVVGCDLKTSRRAIELAERFEGVSAAVGFHPIHIKDRNWQFEVGEIIKLARDPKVLAVGEIGLDTYRLPKSSYEVDLALQKRILDKLLKTAFELEKPVIFHARGGGIIDKLAQTMKRNVRELKKTGAVLHCFPGDLLLAKWLEKQGFYLGFNGMITKDFQWDEVIKQISLKNILLETDAPYLTPVERGKIRNEPLFIKDVAQRIARLKNIPLEKVARTTRENGFRFLKLKI